MQETQEQILQALECPVCLEIPKAPIYQCPNGHHFCSTCRALIKQCAICRVNMPEPPLRCHLAEQLVESISNSGENWDGEPHSKRARLRGLNYCSLLELPEIPGCKENVSKQQFIDHLTQHGVNVVNGDLADITQELEDFINPQNWSPVVFQAHGGVFFLVSSADKLSLSDTSLFIFYKCFMLWESLSVENYSLKLNLSNQEKHLTIKCSLPVLNLEASSSGNLQFSIPLQDLREFGTGCSKNKLAWTIRAQILKPTATDVKETLENTLDVPKVKTTCYPKKVATKLQPSCTPCSLMNICESGKGKRPKVFLDLTYDNDPIGRIVIELRSDIVPFTAENFRALCTGENGFGYKGAPFYNIDTNNGYMIGGDLRDKKGVKTIFGGSFKDENFKLNHSERGVLSMANGGKPNNNTSNFFILLKPAPHLDGKWVVFGKVIKGMEIIGNLEMIINFCNGATNKKTVIANCGQLYEDNSTG